MQKYKPFLITALIILSLIFTAFSVSADVTGGAATINITITGDVTGNKDADDTATILASDGSIPPVGDITDVHDNYLTIGSSGDVTGNAYGGLTYGQGNVYENTVKIENGGIVTGNVYGGYSDNHDYGSPININSNNVIVSGTVTGNVYGGHSNTLDYGNTININSNNVIVSGTVTGNIYGGHSDNNNYGTITVNSNNVIISGTVSGSIYSGYGGLTKVVDDDDRSGVISVYANGDSSANTNGNFFVNNNSITLERGVTVVGDFYGGYAALSAQGGLAVGGVATATNNFSAGAGASAYASSYSDTYADGNSITLKDGVNVSGALYGGYASINMQGGAAIGGTASSAFQSSAASTGVADTSVYFSTVSADSNSITLKDGVTVSGAIYGGSAVLSVQGGAAQGGISSSSANVSYATASAYAYAGATVQYNTTLFASRNSVTLGNNINVFDAIYGGYTLLNIQGGTAIGGTVNTSPSASASYISSNASAEAAVSAQDNIAISATNNSVTLWNNVNVSGTIYGGHAVLNIQGGTAKGGNASASASSTTRASADASAYISDTNISADSNVITIGASVVSGVLYGGYTALNAQGGTAIGGPTSASSSATTSADADAYTYITNSNISADNNIVSIGSSNVIGDLYGGYAAMSVQGGTATAGTFSGNPTGAVACIDVDNVTVSADSNSISLKDGITVDGNLYGGHASLNTQGGTASGDTINVDVNISNVVVAANNNAVSFNGIISNGSLYGGYVLFELFGDAAVTINDSSATATDNTVTIGANSALSAIASLYGGYLGYNNTDGYMPNNYDVFSGNTLNISGKHIIDGVYNFESLSFTLPSGFSVNDSLLTANSVNLDEYNTGNGTTVTDINSTGILTVGNTYNLITANGGFSGDIVNTEASGVYNTAFLSGTYEWIDVGVTNNILTGTLAGISVPIVNPEADAVGEGFAAGLAFLGQAADVRSSIYFVPQGPRFIPFAKMVYGKQYISTGSSVNVKGFSALTGLALNTNFDNGSQLVVGAFIEGGWGDYNSRHSFSNSSAVNGKGDTEYYGGGVLARYALKSGLYSEGSFAAGKTETDFRSWDFLPDTRAKYDYSVPYYSTHVAVGKILSLDNMFDLDIYGKYLWTRQEGDSVTVLNDRFKFKAADSHRVRVGGKLKADVSPQLQPYAGAAYEYEFSGKIKGNLYGNNLNQPSLRGGTGIGELGLVWSPNDAQNLRVDLGVQGYVGKREGVSGGLTVTMSF